MPNNKRETIAHCHTQQDIRIGITDRLTTKKKK